MHSIVKLCFTDFNAHYDMGELADKVESLNEVRNLVPSSLDENGSIYVSWKNHYDAIYLANLLLENVENVRNVSQERIDFHMGQAYFVKAFFVF